MKKAYYMYKMSILEAKSEKAIDEIYSLFIHAALIFVFTTGTVLVQTGMLYKYTKAVLSKKSTPLQLTNEKSPVKSKSTKSSLKLTGTGGKRRTFKLMKISKGTPKASVWKLHRS
jgi:hypothetical protein